MPDESQPNYVDRTFVITASKDIRADDVDIAADTQIAVVTSPINVSCLLGLINFHGFKVEEVTAEVSQEDSDSDDADGDESNPAAEVSGSSESPVVSQEEASAPAVEPNQTAESAEASPDEVDAVSKQFQADGLDEKTATILAEQKLTPAAVKEFIAEGFDLTELEGIGETRAEKILKVYPKAS